MSRDNDRASQKLREFYNKYRYVPRIMDTYNLKEIKDVCITITTQCGHIGACGGVMLVVRRKGLDNALL